MVRPIFSWQQVLLNFSLNTISKLFKNCKLSYDMSYLYFSLNNNWYKDEYKTHFKVFGHLML